MHVWYVLLQAGLIHSFYFISCQSDISGEVVKILKADGGKHLSFINLLLLFTDFLFDAFLMAVMFTDPVGYGDALIAVLPSFPGIMKLQ